METLFGALEQSALASYLRAARWGYAVVNATHILGIALLIGAILPLDLKLLGFWPTIERRALARVLVPVAATGLAIAVIAGMALFGVRAREYGAMPIVWVKLAIVAAGGMAAIAAHIRYGLWLDNREQRRLAHVGLISIVLWLSALLCGRLIAFAS